MARDISLAYLTIPGIEPLQQIEAAARAGYDCVSLRTIPMGLPGEPQIHLTRNADLLHKIKAALKNSGLKPLDIELIQYKKESPQDYQEAFDCAAQMGFTDVLSSVWTEDLSFAVDMCGRVCEQARQFGITVNLEFPVVSCVKTLAGAVKIQDQVGASNLKLLMDMMYCYTDQVTPEKIAALEPERFGIIHLCDWPKDTTGKETVEIVRGCREYCGLGAVDLKGILGALPKNPCSIESPNLSYIKALGAEGHAKRCLEYAKNVLAEVDS